MKKSIVQPYVFFDGKCEEALEFYKRALGAEVNMLTRYKDSGLGDAECRNKIAVCCL